jgi:UTP-glucose-1-phosphate uridylyltransferase
MKALIPAAGLGTRWYPWSRLVPKELLPIGKYPAIHHILEETVAAGIKEVGIIISPEKHIIRNYVESLWEPNNQDIHFKWIYQNFPKGVGDAILCAKDWMKGEPIAVLYPDEIHSPAKGLVQLHKAYQTYPGNWIGLISRQKNRRQIILEIERLEDEGCFLIHGPHTENSGFQIGYSTGRYILDADLDCISQNLIGKKFKKDQEVDDADLFTFLWAHGVRGIALDENIIDIGTPESFYHTLAKFYSDKKRIDEI